MTELVEDLKRETPTTNRKNCQQGLVAYFDILGFTTIASDLDIAKSAELIESTLLTIPTEVAKETKERYGHEQPPGLIVFADSILVWHSIPLAEQGESYHWFYFFSYCAKLMQKMFNLGLPLRGAISEGKFLVKEHCFVGKPITDCHELASNTEWAGCVLIPTAREKLQKMWETAPIFKAPMEQFYVEYEVPLKQACHLPVPPSKLFVIKWFLRNAWKSYKTDPCISLNVDRAFAAHEKTVHQPEVIAKRQNTKAFLEFVDRLCVNSNRTKVRNQPGNS